MLKKRLLVIFLFTVVFIGGAWLFQRSENKQSQLIPTPTAIQPTPAPTAVLQKDLARITDIEILILETFPLQVNVVIKGSFPDSCTTINNITQARQDSIFFVTVSTKRPSDALCAQVITPFEETAALDVLGLKKGIYEVNVNGVVEAFEFKTDNTLSGQNTP